jgi:hypothetical protein
MKLNNKIFDWLNTKQRYVVLSATAVIGSTVFICLISSALTASIKIFILNSKNKNFVERLSQKNKKNDVLQSQDSNEKNVNIEEIGDNANSPLVAAEENIAGGNVSAKEFTSNEGGNYSNANNDVALKGKDSVNDDNNLSEVDDNTDFEKNSFFDLNDYSDNDIDDKVTKKYDQVNLESDLEQMQLEFEQKEKLKKFGRQVLKEQDIDINEIDNLFLDYLANIDSVTDLNVFNKWFDNLNKAYNNLDTNQEKNNLMGKWQARIKEKKDTKINWESFQADEGNGKNNVRNK